LLFSDVSKKKKTGYVPCWVKSVKGTEVTLIDNEDNVNRHKENKHEQKNKNIKKTIQTYRKQT